MTNRILETKKTHICYEFVLSDDDFRAIWIAEEGKFVPYHDRVTSTLETSASDPSRGVPGVSSVDYSREFAPSFSILIEAEHDNEDTHRTIREMLSAKAEAARAAIDSCRFAPGA